MSARSRSRSPPKPSRQNSAASLRQTSAGGRKKSPDATKSRKRSAGGDRSKSPPKSASSRVSSAAKSEASGGNEGKVGPLTNPRVRLQSADIEKRGLRYLDMQGQGMTSVGGALFIRKDIGDLNLSSNNLRIIPHDIKKMTQLISLDLSRNGIRCCGPHDYNGLPAEIGQLPNLTVLAISECNLPFMPPAIWKCQHLQYLDISRNKINILAPEIGNLEKLQHLNAQQTSIMTLPPEIALCQELQEVLLWGNVIESLPETLRELPKLRHLAINYRSFSGNVDDYRDGLLKKGQIQSEHIPPVLFEIPALNGLDLEETKLNVLPDQCSGRYREFYLAKNFFQKIPPMVFGMDILEVLDISDNLLTMIPDELQGLGNLRILRLTNNFIYSIPSSLGNLKKLQQLYLGGNKLEHLPQEIGNLASLKTLVLDRNKIREIPGSITRLEKLVTLDLTDNQVTALPINFHKMKSLKQAHSYERFHKYGLWLHKNPLESPPPEVWKTDDPENIYQYLKRLQIQKTENLQRQKLFVFGESQCGKTSLIRSLMSGKSMMTDGIQDSTAMVNFLAWRTDNYVDFLIHDMGGDEVYKHTHHLFLDPKAIYVIVYDHRKYTPQNHHNALGVWLDLLNTYVPGAVVKVVGTQIDQCYDDIADKIRDQVEEKLAEQELAREQRIASEVDTIEQKLAEGEGSTEEQQQWNRLRSRLMAARQKSLNFQKEVTLVSSAEGIRGLHILISELEMLAVDKELFPHAQRVVAETWLTFRGVLKRHPDQYLTLKKVVEIATNHDMTKDTVTTCLQFLSDMGEILWFPKNPALKKIIFHKPYTLVDILRGLFRSDMSVFLDFDKNKVFSSKGQMTSDAFEQARLQFVNSGQISRSLLLCLWFYLNLSYEGFDSLLELIPRFDMCYTIPQPYKPPSKDEFVPIMVIPGYNEEKMPPDITEYWPETLPDQVKETSVTVTFPLVYPIGLFEKLSSRIQNYVESRMDWQDFIIADLESGSLSLKRDLNPVTYDSLLEIKVRGVNVRSMSEVMGQILGELQGILDMYPGLVWYLALDTKNLGKTSLHDAFPTEAFKM